MVVVVGCLDGDDVESDAGSVGGRRRRRRRRFVWGRMVVFSVVFSSVSIEADLFERRIYTFTLFASKVMEW